jgi:thiamine-phosphate pyrophosphorylase
MNCQLPVSPFLYPILDTQFSTNVVVDAREVIRAGAKILQLRAKNQTKKWVYETIRQMVEEFDICLIVNDHVDVALVTEVAGVHLGQTDFPVTEAKLLLPDKIVGFSTHNAQQFETPVVADYIAVGPVFPTTSKENADPALGVLAVQKIIASKNKPVVAIGGILPEHIPSLIRAGVDGIAVISSLYKGGSVYDNTCKLMDRIHAQV